MLHCPVTDSWGMQPLNLPSLYPLHLIFYRYLAVPNAPSRQKTDLYIRATIVSVFIIGHQCCHRFQFQFPTVASHSYTTIVWTHALLMSVFQQDHVHIQQEFLHQLEESSSWWTTMRWLLWQYHPHLGDHIGLGSQLILGLAQFSTLL